MLSPSPPPSIFPRTTTFPLPLVGGATSSAPQGHLSCLSHPPCPSGTDSISCSHLCLSFSPRGKSPPPFTPGTPCSQGSGTHRSDAPLPCLAEAARAGTASHLYPPWPAAGWAEHTVVHNSAPTWHLSWINAPHHPQDGCFWPRASGSFLGGVP